MATTAGCEPKAAEIGLHVRPSEAWRAMTEGTDELGGWRGGSLAPQTRRGHVAAARATAECGVLDAGLQLSDIYLARGIYSQILLSASHCDVDCRLVQSESDPTTPKSHEF
jgi:hypothetical protein